MTAPWRPEKAQSGLRAANLDVLRALAALSVLAIHAYALGGRVAPLKAQRALDLPLINLASGVWLFFAISGYVISRPFVDRVLVGDPLPRLGAYGLRRGLRIYPLYWAALTVFLISEGADATTPWQFATHLLLLNNLIPGRQEALFSPAWTLTLEVLFYVCVPALAWGARRYLRPITPERLARWLLISWAASILFTVGADLAGDGTPGLWLRGSLPAMWQMFCPGILLAITPHLGSSMRRRAAALSHDRRAWALAGAALLGAGLLYADAPLRYGVVVYQLLTDGARPLFAIGYGIVVGAALAARPWAPRRGLLVQLGVVSYGIYLLHPVIEALALREHISLVRGAGAGALVANAAILAVVACPLAWLSWRFFERPLLALAGHRPAGALDTPGHAHPRLGTLARPGPWLVPVVLVALLIRVFAVAAPGHFTPVTDAADYDRQAVSLVTSGAFPPSVLTVHAGPTAFRPPAFPLFLAGVYAVSGTGSPTGRWRAGRLAEAALGAIAVLLLGLIAGELFGPAMALLSAALAAVYPPLILVGTSLMSESLFIPLMLGAVLLALRARRLERSLGRLMGCGVLIGLAGLTRSVGLIIALPLVVLVWRGAISHPAGGSAKAAGSRFQSPRWRALRAPLCLLAAVLVTLVPWAVRNESALHAFVPISTEGGFALAGTYNATAENRPDYPALWSPPVVQLAALHRSAPNLDEAQIAGRLDSQAKHYAEAHPGYVLEVAFRSALRMLDLPGPALARYEARYEGYTTGLAVFSVYAFWVVGSIALAGVIAGAVRRRRGQRGFVSGWDLATVWAVPALLILASIFFSGGTRYRSPADPFIVLLAALALRRALEEVTHRRVG